jgi:hypothetical protein
LPPARKLLAQHLFQPLLLRMRTMPEPKKDGRRNRGYPKRDSETDDCKKLYRHLGSRLSD